jgi:hypothetical protein
MMQAANPRQGDHLPERPRLDRASDRRVAVEPHGRAVLVGVGGVLADQVQEMTLTKHDHVIESLSTKGGYPPFRVAVLPGGSRRGAQRFDTEVSHSRVEHATETMQHHYSTVAADEKKAAIAKVIELAGVREALGSSASPPGGVHGGVHGQETQKAAQP